MEELFSCRVEVAQEPLGADRSHIYERLMEPFDVNVFRLSNGHLVTDFVLPASDLGEAVAQSLHLVRYASRNAGLGCRLVGVVVTPRDGTFASTGDADQRDDLAETYPLARRRQEVS